MKCITIYQMAGKIVQIYSFQYYYFYFFFICSNVYKLIYFNEIFRIFSLNRNLYCLFFVTCKRIFFKNFTTFQTKLLSFVALDFFRSKHKLYLVFFIKVQTNFSKFFNLKIFLRTRAHVYLLLLTQKINQIFI